MNFLAHLHLSDDDPEYQVGNMIADFVKGPDVAALPPKVRAGVMQHRFVDGFTDRHPLVQRSIVRISKRWGWFSGIIIDVYYDHILARDWPAHAAEPLRAFADRMYPIIRGGVGYMPADTLPFIDHFIGDDRLLRYATTDGIRDTLARLSRRIAERIPDRALPLHDAMPDLLAADAGLTADFAAFFPELRRFAAGAGKGDAPGR